MNQKWGAFLRHFARQKKKITIRKRINGFSSIDDSISTFQLYIYTRFGFVFKAIPCKSYWLYKCTTHKYIDRFTSLAISFPRWFFFPIFPLATLMLKTSAVTNQRGLLCTCTDRRAAVTEPFYIFRQVGKSFKRGN